MNPVPRPETEATTDPLLVGTDLRRRFGPTVALDGASVSVAAGEIVAVMGPSGSGKSTLLHCLAGILRPDSGEVRYRGNRLDTLSETARSRLRRTDIGFVCQFGQLVPELTAAENVMLPLLLDGVSRSESAERADHWLSRLEVKEVAGKRPGALSGGQGQRVAVARALVAAPRVVFTDEPTGSLDSLNGEMVMDLLVDTARQQGTAVLLVTHEPRVAAYADREVILRDGRSVSPAAIG